MRGALARPWARGLTVEDPCIVGGSDVLDSVGPRAPAPADVIEGRVTAGGRVGAVGFHAHLKYKAARYSDTAEGRTARHRHHIIALNPCARARAGLFFK